jgi:phosphoribosyl 1,2-cyclic phosphodiesterase
MKIVNLASGSKGNSTFIRCRSTCVLVDAGVLITELCQKLNSIDEDIKNISAIFITHYHNDHIKSLPQIIKKLPNVKIFASDACLENLKWKLKIKENTFSANELVFHDDLTIASVNVPHDAKGTLGYSFFEDGENKFTLITDCGEITDEIKEFTKGTKLLFIESNHSLKMLRDTDKYPRELKKRIASNLGHLNNDDCANFLVDFLNNENQNNIELLETEKEVAATKIENETMPIIALAHLSEVANNPKLLRAKMISHLEDNNLILDKHYNLHILNQVEISPTFIV